MYDILSINGGKPTAQQTWKNLYSIRERNSKKIYMFCVLMLRCTMKDSKYCRYFISIYCIIDIIV